MTTVALVVDASVAVKWFVREDGSDAAGALLREHLAGRDDATLGAPDILLAEVCAVVGKRERRRLTEPGHSVRVLGAMRRAGLELAPVDGLLDAALALGVAHRHPLYDCLYLALARRLRVPLATFDRRLRDLARLHGLAWEP